jgi:hypothetical protein
LSATLLLMASLRRAAYSPHRRLFHLAVGDPVPFVVEVQVWITLSITSGSAQRINPFRQSSAKRKITPGKPSSAR